MTSAERSWASSPATRKSMQANRSKDTGPELAQRRALHALGLRYRVCARPLPELRRTADIVFRPARVAVEVRGCFWHGCPDHYRAPTANSAYWTAKIQRNQRRDEDTAARLRQAGWHLEIVWEHQDMTIASHHIAVIIAQRRPHAARPPMRPPRGLPAPGVALLPPASATHKKK